MFVFLDPSLLYHNINMILSLKILTVSQMTTNLYKNKLNNKKHQRLACEASKSAFLSSLLFNLLESFFIIVTVDQCLNIAKIVYLRQLFQQSLILVINKNFSHPQKPSSLWIKKKLKQNKWKWESSSRKKSEKKILLRKCRKFIHVKQKSSVIETILKVMTLFMLLNALTLKLCLYKLLRKPTQLFINQWCEIYDAWFWFKKRAKISFEINEGNVRHGS